MKKRLILLSGVAILALCSCNINKQKEAEPVYDPAAVDSIVERKLGVYNLTATNPNAEKEKEEGSGDTIDDYIVSRKKGTTLKMYNINNESVPYVSFSDYVNSYIPFSYFEGCARYEYEFDGNTVTVNNPGNGSYLEFDVNTRIVTYYNFGSFDEINKAAGKQLYSTVFGSGLWNDSLVTYEYYEGKETISFDLSKYSVKDYVHNNEVYLPYDTIRLLFIRSDQVISISYAGDVIYAYTGYSDNESLAYAKYIRSFGTEWIDEDYILSSYNNLALSIDMNFGLDERQSRVEEGKIITYSHDALTMLEPYKERLLSTELDIANDAMCELFAKELDDGGHDYYLMSNLLTTKKLIRTDYSGKETKNTLDTISAVNNSRKEKGIRTADVFPEAVDPNGYYKEYDEDTAYIQFDGFVANCSNGKDYYSMDINEDNYYYDSITLFKYANDKIQANDKIKNVIIDLSANGGGDVPTEEYIASWVCGGASYVMREADTKAMIKTHVEADVNFDGVFNEKDYLSPDINVYVMISNGSFSCGNKLPCDINDNRKENTHFIGSWSGGGSCCVKNSASTYLGGPYRFSCDLQIGRAYSTKDNFVSNENGVKADYLKFDNSDYNSFTDIDNIVNYIHNN